MTQPAVQNAPNAQRSAARLVAVQCVHQMLMSDLSAKETYDHYRTHLMGKTQEGDEYIQADIDLLSKILTGVDARRKDLGDMTLGALQQRETKRLPEPLLLAILLCGAFELMSHHETDAPVIIKDYMHVADGFFQGGEAKIVNAVLDRLGKGLRS